MQTLPCKQKFTPVRFSALMYSDIFSRELRYYSFFFHIKLVFSILMQSTVSPFSEAIAGLGGALTGTIILYPLDVAKNSIIVTDGVAMGIMETIFLIIQERGLNGLYKGLAVEMAKNGATNFVYTYFYTLLKNSTVHWNGSNSLQDHLSMGVNLLIGVIAGCISQTFVNPLNVIATRLQIDKTSPDAISTFWKIVHDGGYQALYTGLLPSYVLSLNPAIQYLVFDQLKFWWLNRKLVFSKTARVSNNICDIPLTLNVWENFVLGALYVFLSFNFLFSAKIIATFCTYPMIVAKTRIQAGATGNMFVTILYHYSLF